MKKINLIIILVLLVAMVALVSMVAKLVAAQSSTIFGMKLDYTLSANLSTGQPCTDDTECNGTWTCKVGPNTDTKYCVTAGKECGQSGGDGYDTGNEVSNDECQSDGTWLCNAGYYNPSGSCTGAGAGYYSAEDSDTRTACLANTYTTSSTAATCSSCTSNSDTNGATGGNDPDDCHCDAGYYDSDGDSGDRSCGVAGNGYYSVDNTDTRTACPAGTYGSSTTLSSSSCSGNCGAGYFGSSSGNTAATCDGGCAAGYFGSSSGNTVATCDGSCKSGSYCESGSTSATQNSCPTTTFDTYSYARSYEIGNCTSCLYGGSGQWRINATESCSLNQSYDLGGSNLILSNSSGKGNLTVDYNITNIGNWTLCDGCRLVIRADITFG